MTAFEAQEVMQYPLIYYAGDNIQNDSSVANQGTAKKDGDYDSGGGEYTIIKHDHVSRAVITAGSQTSHKSSHNRELTPGSTACVITLWECRLLTGMRYWGTWVRARSGRS